MIGPLFLVGPLGGILYLISMFFSPKSGAIHLGPVTLVLLDALDCVVLLLIALRILGMVGWELAA